ncbi:MAG: DUF2023 family protein [Candidatus Gastranaerophilales bacterium]|nr:DUF2023 family protein [Candidatus Gastranaerophilales bacterium]
MDVFYHGIYEYKKGLRLLCLVTFKRENRQKAEERLKKEEISYLIHDIGEEKVNIYFGDQACIEIVKSFNKINLNELSAQEDFILGTMLGYCRKQQCERYLKHLNFSRDFLLSA